MRKLALLLAVTAALCVPAVSAAGTPTPGQLATQMCKSLRTNSHLGKATFRQTFHSFAACLKTQKSQAKSDLSNAAKTCQAERTSDPAAFKAKYGTNTGTGKGAGANAFGKCVSMLANKNAQSDVSTTVAAAKTCKTMKSNNPTGFQTTYGSKKNAFGKCVAAQSKTTTG